MRSIDDKCNKKHFSKIKQLFRINPTDKNEVINYKRKYLYLNGLTADKVKHVLTNGYPKDQNSLKTFESELDYSATDLDFATFVGRNYCEVDSMVKKLSFVFVVCSKENYEVKNEDTIIKDSRKSVKREGKLGNMDFLIQFQPI